MHPRAARGGTGPSARPGEWLQKKQFVPETPNVSPGQRGGLRLVCRLALSF